jgi:hypothetical protein
MLETLQGIARRWQRTRPLLLLGALLALAAALRVLLTSSSQAEDIYLIPALLLFLWCLMLHAFLSLFAQVPPPAVTALPWRQRMVARSRRAFHYLFLLLFALLSLGLLLASWQLAGAWRMMY